MADLTALITSRSPSLILDPTWSSFDLCHGSSRPFSGVQAFFNFPTAAHRGQICHSQQQTMPQANHCVDVRSLLDSHLAWQRASPCCAAVGLAP